MGLTVRQLGAAGLRKLIDEQDQARRRARIDDMRARSMILKEQHLWLILQKIIKTFKRPLTHEQLAKHITRAVNPLTRTTRELGAVYQRPPTRTLEIDGPAGDAANLMWAEAMREGRIGAKSKKWGQYMFALNVTHVVPWVWQYQGEPTPRLTFNTINPHAADRIWSEDYRRTDVLIWYIANGRVVALDNEAMTFFQVARRQGSYATEWVELGRVPHDLGFLPAVEFRSAEPPDGDFWDIGRGGRLVEATIACGVEVASMLYVRRTQNRKLVTVFGESLPAQDSVANPETAITAKTSGGQYDVKFDVHDFDQKIDNFEAVIRFHLREAIASYGVSPAAFGPEFTRQGDAQVVDTETVMASKVEVREVLVEQAREAERELAWKTAAIMTRFGHRLAVDPGLVRETFTATWMPQGVVQDPLKRLEVYRGEMSLGLKDYYDVYMSEHPGTTPAEARAQVLNKLMNRSEVDMLLAAHNLRLDPRLATIMAMPGMMNVPQLQGRAGGMAAGQLPAQQPQEDT